MSFRESMYRSTIDELESQLRQVAGILADEQIASVKEVVDFYRETLLDFADNYLFAEFCGRAVADVTHEVAAVRYGWESPEANAVFDEQDRHLTSWLRRLNALRAEQRPV